MYTHRPISYATWFSSFKAYIESDFGMKGDSLSSDFEDIQALFKLGFGPRAAATAAMSDDVSVMWRHHGAK